MNHSMLLSVISCPSWMTRLQQLTAGGKKKKSPAIETDSSSKMATGLSQNVGARWLMVIYRHGASCEMLRGLRHVLFRQHVFGKIWKHKSLPLSLKPPYIAMATEPSAPLNMPDKCNLKAQENPCSLLPPSFLHPLVLHPPFTHNEISYTLSLPFSLASFTAVRLSLSCLCLFLPACLCLLTSHPPHPLCAFSVSPSLPFPRTPPPPLRSSLD